MLTLTPSPSSRPVKSAEVNCEPWSVLKMSGRLWRWCAQDAGGRTVTFTEKAVAERMAKTKPPVAKKKAKTTTKKSSPPKPAASKAR